MSLLPNATYSAPGVPLYGSGGGGGGGPNLTVSTLTAANTISTLSLNVEDYNAAGNYPFRIRSNSGNMVIENQNGGLGALAVSSINVSSINGAAPGGGGTVGPNLTVSTLTGQNGVVGTDTSFILLQASDGSGRTQLAYNTTDKIGFGTYPFLVASAPAGVDMANLCCALNSNAEPAGFGVGGGTTSQGALVFNDPAGANDNWIIGGGSGMTIYAPGSINFSTIALQQNGVPFGGAVSTFNTASVSSLSVSSINNAVYPPPASLTNVTVAFINGSGDGSTYTSIVNSNTGGLPTRLTSTLITNPANSYLVSYSLFGGSNSDTSSYTKLQLYVTGGSGQVITQTLPGIVSNNWLSNGYMGATSVIVNGTSALALEGGAYSATTSTILYFDEGVSLKVTNLGASS